MIPFPFDMSGKTVVVTGSTKGIGLALAKGFHACGARTIISSNMQDDVGAALAGLRRDGAELEGIVCDLWNPESVRTFAARVGDEFGGVDTLVAHGGGYAKPDTIESVGRPRWKDVPSWFLLAKDDRMIVPETQRFMAARMKATIRAHAVDHTPIVTAPAAVTDIIREATAAVAD